MPVLLIFSTSASTRADRRQAFCAAPHQHDALDDVVVVVLAGDAEPRLIADRDRRDVPDAAPACRCSSVSIVLRMSSIEWIRPTPRTIAACGAEIDRLAADIDVAVVEGLQHLRQRQPVVDQPVEIDGDVVGLGLAAPAVDVDDARHRLEAALQHPVLDRLEIGHRIARRPDDAIAVDLADRAVRRDLRLGAVGQRRQLRQPVDHPLLGLVVGEVVGELELARRTGRTARSCGSR